MPKPSTVTLTARLIDTAKIPPGKKDVMLWDARVPGLGIRKTATSASWKMRLLQDGRRVNKTIGEYPSTSLQEARKIVEEARGRRAAGEPVVEKPTLAGIGEGKAQRGKMTVDEAFAEYMEAHVRPKLRRADRTEKMWQHDLSPLVGGAVLSRLRRADVHRVLDHLGRTKTPAMAAINARLFRAFLNWAGDRELAEPGIAARLKIASVPKRDRILTMDELRRVVAASADMGVRPHGVIRLSWLTACRANEVAGMRWDELSFDEEGRKEWTVPPSRMKGKRKHVVPMTDATLRVVEEQREVSGGSDFVFPSLRLGPEHPYDPGNLPGQLRRRTGIEDLQVHDVRRTASHYLLTQGVPVEVIKSLLAHSQKDLLGGGATVHYAGEFRFEEGVRKAVELLAAAGVVD